MTSVSADRRFGVNSGAALKVPVRAATTANLTLSGEQTVDGVALVTNDRVLVKNQTTGADNGIYLVDTGTWARSADWDGSYDVVTGTAVYVTAGTTNAGTYWAVSTTGTITVGTTSVAFVNAVISSAASISTIQSGTGALTRTVSAALAAMVRSGDFDTAGHFNTAQAALTETLGIKALRIGTGSGIGSGITFPTSSAYGNHAIYVADTTFNGIVDPILIYGYNPGRANTSEPALYYGLEGRYYDLTNTWLEHNQDYVSDDGLTSKRFFTQQVNRATHLSTWQWSGSSFDFTAVLDGTPSFYINSKSVAVGTIAPDVNVRIQVSGVPDTSTTQYGVSVKPAVTATTTNGYLSFNSAPTTAVAAFTMSALAHFNVVDVVKGAGSAVTEQWGFRCQDLTAGGTNKAFVGEVTSGSNKYNAYFSGTADNFLEGKVKIGATSETANGTGTVTVGNLAPGTTALVIKKWWTMKDSAGTTWYIPMMGA